MKPVYAHRLAVNLPRNRYSREDVKKMNNILISDKKIQRNYTGLNGRNICFQFPTEKEKEDFKTHIISFMDNCI